jgi:hypothetical protein
MLSQTRLWPFDAMMHPQLFTPLGTGAHNSAEGGACRPVSRAADEYGNRGSPSQSGQHKQASRVLSRDEFHEAGQYGPFGHHQQNYRCCSCGVTGNKSLKRSASLLGPDHFP